MMRAPKLLLLGGFLFILIFAGCRMTGALNPAPAPTEASFPPPSAPTGLSPTLRPTSQPTAMTPSLPATLTPTESAPAPTPATETPSSQPAIVIHDYPGPLYETVFTIPLGEMGLRYRGVGVPDMEITGPNALAALPNGNFVLADLIDNRLLQFDRTGQWVSTIELYPLDILNVSDLRASGESLFILEISFKTSPERYRVHRLSLDGRLIASYDLPSGLHLEDGLTGIAIGGAGEILVELEGGSRYHQLVDARGNMAPTKIEGYPYGSRIYKIENQPVGGTPRITVGDVIVETQTTKGLGGLLVLGVLPDGSFYVIRHDVVNDRVIQVDETVHLLNAHGKQLGVARVPIAENYYYVPRQLALGPDRAVYAMLPRSESIDVIRLNFFERLEPLIPGAIEPQIKHP